MTEYTLKLNLPKPAQGNTNWKQYIDAFHDAVDDIGALFSQSFFVSGILVDEEIVFDGWYPQADITVTKIGLFCREAPTGADARVDTLVGGAEQTKIAALAAGNQFELTDIADLDVTAGQRVGFKIKQVGSSVAGGDMTITIYFRKKAIATIP